MRSSSLEFIIRLYSLVGNLGCPVGPFSPGSNTMSGKFVSIRSCVRVLDDDGVRVPAPRPFRRGLVHLQRRDDAPMVFGVGIHHVAVRIADRPEGKVQSDTPVHAVNEE